MGALSRLAVKESIRNRVIVVFVVFVVILLFAGWFLDPASPNPARLYLEVVLTTTGYLTLLLALFLSALSLPADIKNRTLHTVVTKPVRPSEIVLGRMLGFTIVGTVLLAVMGVISYVFVVRGLSHTHELTAADLRPVGPVARGEVRLLKGLTSKTHNHQHEVTVDAEGQVRRVETAQGHWHKYVDGRDKEAAYLVGPPEGMLLARVPVYGKLRFKDRCGADVKSGINVGDEWTYRSFIEGAAWPPPSGPSRASAESHFPDGLPVEMTIEVFRTYKGDIETGHPRQPLGPQTGQRRKAVEVRIFAAKKFATDEQFIPRKWLGRGRQEVRPLPRLGHRREGGGLAAVPARGQQYFGMAQADLYLRARDASFA